MAHSQVLPVGDLELDGLMRSRQLMGRFDSSLSFTVRPLNFPLQADLGTDSSDIVSKSMRSILFGKSILPFKSATTFLGVLPASVKLKYNSTMPYGWNDEGMIPAKGLQTELSLGIAFTSKWADIRLQPQWVYAGNPQFPFSSSYGAPTNGRFSKLFAGQSFVKLKLGPLSAGISSANLWWGPGQYSALLLSNNAPGFTHLTIQTSKPIRTPIGSFEFQLVGGKLNEDSADGRLYENFHLKPAVLTDDWRYLNAIVLSYQPSFFKGFTLGLTRAFQIYHNEVRKEGRSFFRQYLPVFSSLFKNSLGGAAEDSIPRDQQLSLFARWVFPKAHTEFYVEYGYNDHSANTRDFILDPTHSAAYITGGKTLIPLNKKNRWIEINGELTHMAQSVNYVVRNAGNWYLHGSVLQGMTNEKQILGAGSGEGNNVQTLTISRLEGLNKLGLTLQRIQHDPMALVGNFGNLGLRPFEWTDFAVGFLYRKRIKQLMLNADIQWVTAHNYAWTEGNKQTNLYASIQLSYLW
jgi:hypothetical protein